MNVRFYIDVDTGLLHIFMKSRNNTPSRPTRKDPNEYPKGWDRKRVEGVIAHYENQTEEEAVAEDESPDASTTFTMIAVPNELVSKVQKLIAKRAS